MTNDSSRQNRDSQTKRSKPVEAARPNRSALNSFRVRMSPLGRVAMFFLPEFEIGRYKSENAFQAFDLPHAALGTWRQ